MRRIGHFRGHALRPVAALHCLNATASSALCRAGPRGHSQKGRVHVLVLGIDPGTAITGFGLVSDEGGGLRCVGMGCIRTAAHTPLPERLTTIHSKLSALIARHRPDCVAIEQLFFNTNATSALAVGHARGVALLAACQAGLPVSEYTPLQGKLAVAGYGKADKKQMQSMVRLLLGLDSEPRPDDVADALAIAICHINSAPYHVMMSRNVWGDAQ